MSKLSGVAFDNEAFTKWLLEFERTLMECGMPEAQAKKYRGVYYGDAVAYFVGGVSTGDAAMLELLG